VVAVFFKFNDGTANRYGNPRAGSSQKYTLDEDEIIVRVDGLQYKPGRVFTRSPMYAITLMKFTTNKNRHFTIQGIDEHRHNPLVDAVHEPFDFTMLTETDAGITELTFVGNAEVEHHARINRIGQKYRNPPLVDAVHEPHDLELATETGARILG
jgi:hypothetical protein